MNSENCVYLGPFIACKNPLVETSWANKVCPRCSRSLGNDPFCSKCGEKGDEIIQKGMTSKFTFLDVRRMFLDSKLSESDMHFELFRNHNEIIFFPNKGKNPRQYWVNLKVYNSIFFREQDLSCVEKEKEDVAHRFKKHIKALKSLFGEENVEIRWGALTYLN